MESTQYTLHTAQYALLRPRGWLSARKSGSGEKRARASFALGSVRRPVDALASVDTRDT